LKNGIRNAIGIQGTSIPPTIAYLSKTKESTIFLDGDRGGDLILKEAISTCDIDFVARAPEGKEVEDLTKKEIYKALREKEALKSDTNKKYTKTPERAPARQPIRRNIGLDADKKEFFKENMSQLTGSKAAYYFKDNKEPVGKVPVKEIYNTIRESKAQILILDGFIDQRLVDLSARNGIKFLVGTKAERIRVPRNIKVVTLDDLE